MALSSDEFGPEEEEVDHPVRYLPIRHLYSSTAPCPSGSSNVASKKVKARRLAGEAAGNDGAGDGGGGGDGEEEEDLKKPIDKPVLVYRRRAKKPRSASDGPQPNLLGVAEADFGENGKNVSRRRSMKYEMLRLGEDSRSPSGLTGPRLRASGGIKNIGFGQSRRKGRPPSKGSSVSAKLKKWVELDTKGADPHALVGLACKVYWPRDDAWYKGSVTAYDPEDNQHRVDYDDGEVEHLIVSNEKIKFNVSSEEMRNLNLKYGVSNMDKNGNDYNEMLALAATFHDGQDPGPGDVVWAKLTGHALWPAVVVDESCVGANRGLQPLVVDQSILVQFFGTHDFARIKLKRAIPFANGLLSCLHQKCKQVRFHRSLDEVKMYMSTQQLPENMLRLQKGVGDDDRMIASGDDEGHDPYDDFSGDEATNTVEGMKPPIEIGNLCVTDLGKIIYDSEYFHNKHQIWPEGYTAIRKFVSIKDPSQLTSYKMEVLRNPKLKARPLFRVTSDDGEQIDGPSPAACWKVIYNVISNSLCNGFLAEVEGNDFQMSGSYMFGFSNPQISQLIKELPYARLCSKYSGNSGDQPLGYRAVKIDWKEFDRCGVCNMDEEYENNLFLQCENCRMMVHARCYGELEPLDGVLWLCNLCRPEAPKVHPRCCLCPVSGGAMKPTTDGLWAHLTCAMWIPETCLVDVKKMEPIDGISRINKDRWKLLCSICGVSYGACIQCSHNTCRVAYHPLCARAADLCVELEDEDKIHLMSLDEEDDQCIRLLSFCKKHRQPSNERPSTDETLKLPLQLGPSYVSASNPSGCARSEPYNFSERRGQKQPQVLSAASLKRLFVEDMPYLVTGRQTGMGFGSSSNGSSMHICPIDSPKMVTPQQKMVGSVSSMAEKYRIMKATFRKRLAFGKSRIHGFGVFAKLEHKAGDMVIEYIGEVVRQAIADIRERRIYNSLVGAGTYMFRIDDERVIDATRAGSIAHLINHSCEPNCYSRVISINGDEHIIIFAKRDIKQWEELTYDYRFSSKDEQLACYCGFPNCRGIVNDPEAEEKAAQIRVPRSSLVHYNGEEC